VSHADNCCGYTVGLLQFERADHDPRETATTLEASPEFNPHYLSAAKPRGGAVMWLALLFAVLWPMLTLSRLPGAHRPSAAEHAAEIKAYGAKAIAVCVVIVGALVFLNALKPIGQEWPASHVSLASAAGETLGISYDEPVSKWPYHHYVMLKTAGWLLGVLGGIFLAAAAAKPGLLDIKQADPLRPVFGATLAVAFAVFAWKYDPFVSADGARAGILALGGQPVGIAAALAALAMHSLQISFDLRR
jgi:hypothetical protein